MKPSTRLSGRLVWVIAPILFLGLAASPPSGDPVEGASGYEMGGGYASTGGGHAGTEVCASCHSDIADQFGLTAHGRAGATTWASAADCESCHGPGRTHADSGGEKAIFVPAKADTIESTKTCLKCHEGTAARYWKGSVHENLGLSCASCHKVHSPWTKDAALAKMDKNEACLSCHPSIRKKLWQRSSHPLRRGTRTVAPMACSDCHAPHGSVVQGKVAGRSVNDKCYECHAEKRGPFLWEHIPVREDCTVCHNPHGSNQRNLLVTSAPRLCQSCHLLGHHQTVPGTPVQTVNVNRSCLNCHPAIHGSNHPSGIVLMR